jgi:hypothetical protein
MKSVRRFYQFVFVLLMGCLSLSSLSSLNLAQAAVWESRNEWTPEAEARFSQWVKTQWKADVFTNPSSLLYGLPTDCADAAYTMRATFSYLNQLPFAMLDPSGGSKPITNEMSRFDRQGLSDKDKFIEFLKYIHNMGSSTTIAEDTYPVLIDRNWVRPGDVLLRHTHHVYEIRGIDDTGYLRLISSTVPRAVRTLNENKHFVPSDQFMNPNSGVRAWREPKDLFVPTWKLPGFSEEQFQFPKESYPDLIKARLSLVNATPDEELKTLYDGLCNAARERVTAVNAALEYRDKNGDRCMNAAEFDDYSTTSRDKNLRSAFDSLREFVSSRARRSGDFREKALWKEAVRVALDKEPTGLNSFFHLSKPAPLCMVSYKNGVSIDLQEFRHRLEQGLMSDDPNVKVEVRWGEVKSENASSCPRY